MNIQNKAKNIVFSYDADKPIINGKTCWKKHADSSLLYDEIRGVKKVEEMNDRPAQKTR